MDRADVKDRGRKHVRSKNRYKGNRFTKETTQLAARAEVLPSNHDRYELSDSDDQASGADFALLANAPLSVGGHFQFKSDALQATQESIDSSSNYFQSLDADLLSYSLTTIPFNIRCSVESKYITEKHIEKLREDAERNKSIYEEYLKYTENKKCKDFVKSESEGVHRKLKVSEQNLNVKQHIEDPEQAELEDWLDDVLNS